jgi:hypothetical protein
LEHLQGLGLPVQGRFTGDDQGWFRAELLPEGAAVPLALERYLVSEESIRAELNNWAAWVETTGDGPEQTRLMQRVIGTAQLFTLCPAEGSGREFCEAVCRHLARQTDGVYQVDGHGFFDAAGTLLLKE